MKRQKTKVKAKKAERQLTHEYYLVALIVSVPIIDYLGSFLSSIFSLPLFFDSLGTILGTVLGGFWVGAFGGIVYNITTIFTTGDPLAMVWAISSAFMAGVVWYLLKTKRVDFNNYASVFNAGIILAFLNAILTSLISLFVFHGQESFLTISTLQNIFSGILPNGPIALFFGHLILEIVDKSLVFLLAFGIYRIVKDRKLMCPRTLVMPVIVLLVVVIFTGWMNKYETANYAKLQEDILIKNETQQAHSMLETVWEGYRDGMYSFDQAKTMGASLLRNLRYGDDDEGYFWADTSDGTNVVLYGRQDVEEKNRMNAEINGVDYIKQIIANGKKPGGGYTDYFFTKKDGAEPLAKRGYSLYFSPFDWIIGTGYYSEDLGK